jgi:hypothetical protein
MARTAALLAAVLLAGCGNTEPPSPHSVSYALAWTEDDVVRDAGGASWQVTNDLGYQVRVTRGYLTTYSMELVECPKAVTGFATPPSAFAALLSLLEATAWAGHSAGTPNPAAIRALHIESLTAPVARELATVTLAPQAYCQLHYLIARAAKESSGLPDDLDMVDASLHVEGTYRVPGSELEKPFRVHTGIANGGLFNRSATPPAPIRVDTGRAGARVTVRRRLGAMFDGVAFATMTEGMVAGQIMQALIDHVEIEIESRG